MLKDSVQDALNDQLNAELFSAYIYYSMSAYYESVDLPGIAGWMRAQAQEELFHVSKFFTYITERDGRVLMKEVDGPPVEWGSPVEAMMAAHEHEHLISERINNLVTLAKEQNDVPTENFLQWFVAEQVEEEATTWEAVRKLKMVGNDGAGLYMVDKEFGTRVFNLPAADGEE